MGACRKPKKTATPTTMASATASTDFLLCMPAPVERKDIVCAHTCDVCLGECPLAQWHRPHGRPVKTLVNIDLYSNTNRHKFQCADGPIAGCQPWLEHSASAATGNDCRRPRLLSVQATITRYPEAIGAVAATANRSGV